MYAPLLLLLIPCLLGAVELFELLDTAKPAPRVPAARTRARRVNSGSQHRPPAATPAVLVS